MDQEPIGGQALECLAHRRLADAPLHGNITGAKGFVGRKLTGHDR
jgi:hypothetical protein